MENIYLVGFMGCGKSTIAEKLSKEINFKHIDTDSIIEEQNSMSISEIFKNKDEKYFRNEEYKILEKILNQKKSMYWELEKKEEIFYPKLKR